MLESAGLHEGWLLSGVQFATLFFFTPHPSPVAKPNTPNESHVLSAAPFSACNCLLCAGVGTAQPTSVPSSLAVNLREGNSHISMDRQ